jgi:flavin reductase
MAQPLEPSVAAGASRDRYIEAMSRGVAMVNVVTTDGVAGRFGATVSAMSSVSADMSPPALLVCLHRDGHTAAAVMDNGVFCLNMLQKSQRSVADCFANRVAPASGDKFDCADWARTGSGSWRLADAMASFDCHVLKGEIVGTHYVIIGSVENIAFGAERRALLYGGRTYCTATVLPARHNARAQLR